MSKHFSAGFMPFLRPGDLLFTAVALLHRMNGECGVTATIRSLRNSVSYCLSLTGTEVHIIVPKLFGPGVDAREVLEQNTPFGVYSKVLDQADVNRCAESVLSWGKLSTFHSRYNIHGLAPPYLRSCEHCLKDDLAERGFGAWRVLHHIRSIDHCPEHGTRLQNEVRSTRQYKWQVALPEGCWTSEPARQRLRDSIPESDGYAHYLKLWPKIFSGEVEIARNRTWVRVVSRAVAACRSEDRLVRAVKDQLRKQWGATPQKITRLLRFRPDADFVFQQICNPWGVQNIASRIVVLNGIFGLGMDAVEMESPVQNEMLLSRDKVARSDAIKSESRRHPRRVETSEQAFVQTFVRSLSANLLSDVVQHARIVGSTGIVREAERRMLAS